MKNYIVVEGISVIRGKEKVLDDISLEIGEQDVLTIIGPNGAGKTTLLHCLMGIITPDDGVIKKRNGMRIGYVPQQFWVGGNMPMTVEHFLRLHRKVDASILETLASTLSLPHLDKQLSCLSGGDLQRVLLARSLVNDPHLLFLDEPTKNLDISGQIAFYQSLQNMISARNISVVMVSHDLHMVMTSTKRVLCLYHHVCCTGTPRTVAQDPEFISLFGKDMSSMMAIYQHKHDHSHDGEYSHR